MSSGTFLLIVLAALLVPATLVFGFMSIARKRQLTAAEAALDEAVLELLDALEDILIRRRGGPIEVDGGVLRPWSAECWLTWTNCFTWHAEAIFV